MKIKLSKLVDFEFDEELLCDVENRAEVLTKMLDKKLEQVRNSFMEDLTNIMEEDL